MVHQKNLKYWESVKLTVVGTSSLKVLFSLESSTFIINNKYCKLFPWSQSSLCSFLWKHLPGTDCLSDHNLSLLQVKVVFHENNGQFNSQLIQLHKYFFLETVILFQKCICCKTCLCVVHILSQNFRKKKLGGGRGGLVFFFNLNTVTTNIAWWYCFNSC